MHWGLQTLAKLVPACGPSGRGGQAKGIFFLISLCGNRLASTVSSPKWAAWKRFWEKWGGYACLLCSRAFLQEILTVPGPLAAPSSSSPWERGLQSWGPPGGTGDTKSPASREDELQTTKWWNVLFFLWASLDFLSAKMPIPKQRASRGLEWGLPEQWYVVGRAGHTFYSRSIPFLLCFLKMAGLLAPWCPFWECSRALWATGVTPTLLAEVFWWQRMAQAEIRMWE